MARSAEGHLRLTRRHFLVAPAGAIALGLYAGEIARHELEIAERTLAIRGLPVTFQGLRLAQVSDIHLAEYTEDFFLQRVVRRVNAAQPDVVLLTGDFVSDGPWSKAFSRRAAGRCAEILSELTCPLRYAILGNHDVFVDAATVTGALRANGITVLINQQVALERGGCRLWLCGLDDPYAGAPDIHRALPGSNADPVLLLLHEPAYLEAALGNAPGRRIDIALAGHTHGGQVRLPFLPPIHLPPMSGRYLEGLFHVGATQLYVNRGIGTVDLPIRLNCPPEITIFTLKTAAVEGRPA